MYLVRITAIGLTASILLSGCAVSRAVYNIGRTPIHLDPDNVIIASDGSVALQMMLVKRKGYFKRYALVQDESAKKEILSKPTLPASMEHKDHLTRVRLNSSNLQVR